MPLRDHFHPPIAGRLPWPSLHTGWIGALTTRLNAFMPPEYLALDTVRIGSRAEADIAAVEIGEFETEQGEEGQGGLALATRQISYAPPAALGTCSYAFPDVAEIRIYTDRGERTLVGAIELVSPANKDRPEKREAFVGKCLDYLASGASLVIVDVVTGRHANLHNAIAERLGAPDALLLPDDSHLYATAYRPVIRGKKTQIEFWINPLAIGQPLPTMPLRLIGDLFVPVELERTYTETCVGRRLI